MELNGIEVVSANTDGIVLRYKKTRREDVRRYLKEWEDFTNFKTEETLYRSIHIKDVNNYIAVNPDGKCKFKGEYSNPWSDDENSIFRFHKNPENRVCVEAVQDYILNKTPLSTHILNEKDILKFVCVANVRGGGHKDGVYLGKVVRWYYKDKERTGINYVGSGNQVQSSLGAWPLMDLPSELPTDIDYKFYYERAKGMLVSLGIIQTKVLKALSLLSLIQGHVCQEHALDFVFDLLQPVDTFPYLQFLLSVLPLFLKLSALLLSYKYKKLVLVSPQFLKFL